MINALRRNRPGRSDATTRASAQDDVCAPAVVTPVESVTAGSSGEPSGIDDVLDVEGATQLLRIGRNTIYEMVARNQIPHRRFGKRIRFSRAAVMRWLASWSLQGAKERQ